MGVGAPHQCSLGAAACDRSSYADARYIDDVIATGRPTSLCSTP